MSETDSSNRFQESTIRKLRQLLAQKTGETSSVDSFKMAAQPAKPDDVESKPVDPEDFAIPSDGRLIIHVKIPETETILVPILPKACNYIYS
jgi:hypothetical protein